MEKPNAHTVAADMVETQEHPKGHPRRGMSCLAKMLIGCGCLTVLGVVVMCAGGFGAAYYFQQQGEGFATRFESQGFELRKGQAIQEAAPVEEDRVYLAQVVEIKSGARKDLAIAAQVAEIDGTVEGDIHFYGQVLTVKHDGVVKGTIYVKLAQVIQVDGTVQGDIDVEEWAQVVQVKGTLGGEIKGTVMASSLDQSMRQDADSQSGDEPVSENTEGPVMVPGTASSIDAPQSEPPGTDASKEDAPDADAPGETGPGTETEPGEDGEAGVEQP